MREPIYVDWAITSTCNLDCRHCVGMNRDDLNHREAVQIARDIIDLSPRWVILEGGEPVLRNDLPGIGDMLREENIDVFVITNGNAFNRERLQKLKTFSPKVLFSIDGADPDTYEHAKRGADFDRAVEWAEKCSEEGLFHGITTVLSKQNLGQEKDLIRLVEDLGGESITFIPLKPFGDDDEPQKYYSRNVLSPEEHERAVRRIYNVETNLDIFYDEPFLWNLASKHDFSVNGGSDGITIPDLKGCAASHSLYIQTDGDVRPCMFCPEELSLGNAAKEPLERIWSRTRQSETLSSWMNQDMREGSCGECPQFESCRGCLARTAGLLKNTAGSDPSCPLTDGPGDPAPT